MKLTELIGNTPLVEMVNINSNPKVKIFGKLEGQNPAGSVKDRAAFNMIHEAILRGDLKSGDTIVEATSGNTGIALAMVGQMMNIRVKLIMPDSATVERVKTMKAYGAEVILTPSEKTIEYSRSLAQELSQTKGWTLLDQFGNDDNFKAHIKTTGPEIWEATQGRITHFVSSMGTTGTIMGVSRFLKSKNPDIQIVGCQPTEGSKIPGIRRWTPEFLPKFYDPSRVDQFVDVSQEDAVHMSRKLAKEEGILAGMSSGGAMHAAVNLAKGLTNGVIVSIVCDRGDRYLSSSLFE